MYVKTSKHHPQGHKDNSYQNLIFLKLKLGYQPNRTTNLTNSGIELFYGDVSDIELSLVK
jgi:hypothetical protein